MIDWKGKKVLGIGPGSLEIIQQALSCGAELVEVIRVLPEDRDPSDTLIAWEGRKESDGSVVLRNVSATTLEDEDWWDIVVLEGIHQSHLPVVLPKAQRALTKNGLIAATKDFTEFTSFVNTVPVKPAGEPANVMLHVHNVRRCGGTGNFVYDMARCFPEWSHVALCVNDPGGDPQWINDVSEVMRSMYSPVLTKEILDEINPRVLVLHATVGARLEGEWPYHWLQDGGRRFVIALHHIPTYPLLPADLDVFVSEYVKSKYVPFLDRMKAHLVMPPCMDLVSFAPVKGDLFTVTTGGKHCSELKQLVNELPDWDFDFSPPGRLGALPAYLSQFQVAVIWSGLQETWCRTVTEAMAAGCLTIAHRAGAIPEQITSGENGYLFENGTELVKILNKVKRDPDQALALAAKGRDWALENAGFGRMKKELYPFLMQAALRKG